MWLGMAIIAGEAEPEAAEKGREAQGLGRHGHHRGRARVSNNDYCVFKLGLLVSVFQCCLLRHYVQAWPLWAPRAPSSGRSPSHSSPVAVCSWREAAEATGRLPSPLSHRHLRLRLPVHPASHR